jgi:hypothetical protein
MPKGDCSQIRVDLIIDFRTVGRRKLRCLYTFHNNARDFYVYERYIVRIILTREEGFARFLILNICQRLANMHNENVASSSRRHCRADTL